MYPILAALRRNALGPTLIAVQIALTLAILSNALFIIHARRATMARPSGIDESQLFAIQNQWVGDQSDISARVLTDLAALRLLPGVADAYVTNSYPLSGFLWAFGVTLHPQDKSSVRPTGIYLADSHTLRTLGLRLIAGRNFTADDVQPYSSPAVARRPPGGVIVTRQLAQQLAPGGNVLGHVATVRLFGAATSVPIVGIVDDLQVAAIDLPAFLQMPAYSSVLIPYRYTADTSYYVVRAQSAAQVDPAMKAATARLYTISRARVLRKVESLSDARRRVYRGDRGQAIMLSVVSAILLGMTGWGIVGLTSCWVNQRRRHIGIRRALGATRMGIVRYFQTENLLIALAGIVPGTALAILANLWLIGWFQMPRMNSLYALLGAIVVLLLGQLATLWPALRAASVPPAEATRTV